ncbi:MAG: hypothetical protein WCF17_06010 [Terracidiphilus sp.]
MARRIGFWALAGAAVALLWFLYFTWLTWGAYHGGPPFVYHPSTQTYISITMPFTLLAFQKHYAMTWYVSLIFNAANYACIGLAIEALRLTFRPRVAPLRH